MAKIPDLRVDGEFAGQARLKEQRNWKICQDALKASQYIRENTWMTEDKAMREGWLDTHYRVLMMGAMALELVLLAWIAIVDTLQWVAK